MSNEVENKLNIDQGTLNGFGIITVDLSNNHVKSIQYTDLNTDYYIIRIIATFSDINLTPASSSSSSSSSNSSSSSSSSNTNKTYYCVTNYDLTYINNENIDIIAGPFAKKYDAIKKINEDSSLGYTTKDNVFINLSIDSDKRITFTEVSKNDEKITNNFTFFSPTIRF